MCDSVRLPARSFVAEEHLLRDNPGRVSESLVLRLAANARSPYQLQAAGWYLVGLGQPDRARELVDRAITTGPLCWSCQRTRAKLLEREGRYDEAIEAVERALALAPESMPVDPSVGSMALLSRWSRARLFWS